MTALKRLFDKLSPPQLKPDGEGAVLVSAKSYAVSLPDGTLSVVYGDANDFKVQKNVVKDGRKAVWYDPVSGKFADAGQPRVEGPIATYTPKQVQNSGGGTDWLLLIGSNERLRPIQKR